MKKTARETDKRAKIITEGNLNETMLSGKLSMVVIIAGACILYAVSSGIKGNYGIMLNSIVAHSGVAYERVSFILAVGQIVFGIAQPAFGVLAIRRSNRFVLALGAMLMVCGLAGVGYCHSFFVLFIALGMFLPAGTGAIAFGIIMSAITPKLGEKRAATASGIITAASGIGCTAFSVLLQTSLSALGLVSTMFVLSVPILIMIPIALLSYGDSSAEAKEKEKAPLKEMLIEAVHSKTYIIITLGFFTCGFHMSIIETHLYSQLISYGIEGTAAALCFSVCGIGTMVGSIICGIVMTKIKSSKILSFLYTYRAAVIFSFLILPKTAITVLLFGWLIGIAGGTTIPPTSAVVSKLFGTVKLGTLFGVCYFVHQIGSFCSAWLGGICVSLTGGYTLIWCISASLSLAAGVACFFAEREA